MCWATSLTSFVQHNIVQSASAILAAVIPHSLANSNLAVSLIWTALLIFL